MNFARDLVSQMERHTLSRLLTQARGDKAARGGTALLKRRATRTFEMDLVLLLNMLHREELAELAHTMRLPDDGDVGALRQRLWHLGACREARGDHALGRPWQPVPEEVRGRLVYIGPERGLSPPCDVRPRPIPEVVDAPVFGAEPDCADELLDRATRLVGVELGTRGKDKGAYGTAIARLLGLVEDGHAEPDWRGDVEVKTLPVVRDNKGRWRVKEDPAISMSNVRPLSKLTRVLWIARVADDPASPILSWYFQEADGAVLLMACRHLHQRPKGPKGTDKRGWYLRKHFFSESGFIRSLNG